MFMMINEVIDLIKESGVKEYEYIVYNDNRWEIRFKQLGNKNNCIVFYGKNVLERIYIFPINKKHDKDVLESIIKGNNTYDDLKLIKMVYITDDSEEDNKDE